MPSFRFLLAPLLALLASSVCLAGPAPDDAFLLSGFEPGGPDWAQGAGRVVEEHATEGAHARRVENSPTDYVSFQITDGAALRPFKDYDVLRVDIFNPQEKPVLFTLRIDDVQSKDYGSRFNNDGCVAAPGKSTLEVDLTGLTRSNARNFAEKQKLDVAQLRLVGIALHPSKEKTVLFFDNVRLAQAALAQFDGLRAFDFGPAKGTVYPGFECVGEGSFYSDARGYGWTADAGASTSYMPDALGGDYGWGKEFRVRLASGDYEVNVCLDALGLWGRYPSFPSRSVRLNGEEVLSETMTGEEYLRRYFALEDAEDLPGQDLWAKFIEKRLPVHRFTAHVTDGTLRLESRSDDRWGRIVSFVVLYPAARQAEGRAWMDTLAKKRHDDFNAKMVVSVPKPTGDEPLPTSDEKARGFITFVRHTEVDIPLTARPAKDEIGKPLLVQAARGERAQAQIGLYPVAAAGGVTVTAGDLAGPNGKTIPASAVRVRKVRHFLKRAGSSNLGSILPFILQDFQTLDLKPGVTRGLWVTLTVPPAAAAGKYTGAIKIGAAGKTAEVPVQLTVLPFRLDRVTDITISVTGSTVGSWRGLFPGLDEKWWTVADLVMKDQAEHGMNAVTGGPGGRITSVKDGKAEIDYAAMDRWLALAAKHGLTMPGDSYQGLDVDVPSNQSKDCVVVLEKQSRERFGVSYEELLRIVYGDVARHAKEKGWPPRVYYFLDEPRPEYGNVGPCAELIRLRTRACPETLFSGYYSTGDGRDVYFQTMPVSIAHVTKTGLDLATKAGKQLWEYDGQGVRHNIGRWCFVASRLGMKGYERNGYMYVCSDPYFDYSDDEGSWSQVYPSRTGVSASVGWQRTSQGVDDYRYLAMCETLAKKARAAGKAAQEADAAEAFLKETLAGVMLDDRESARLAPEGYDDFRRTLAKHITALAAALGE